jgi:hypothetical protein
MRTSARAIVSLAALSLALGVARAGIEVPTGSVRSVTSDIRTDDYGSAVDLVFVSEGYLADEADDFLADARAMAARVDTDPAAAPFHGARPFNYHYVFVSSRERAPWLWGAPPADTAVRAHPREGDGLLETDDAAVEREALAAPDVDVVVVVTRFITGGPLMRGNADMYYTGRHIRIPRENGDALVHELGHALYGLGDEYVERQETLPPERSGEVAPFANLSVDPSGARWRAVTSSVVEGGAGWAHGVYHAELRCRMNATDEPSFCSVCRAAIANARPVWPGTPTIRDPVPGWAQPSGASLAARWDAGPGAPPVAYLVSLSQLGPDGRTYATLRSSWVEGRTWTIGTLAPGAYSFAVTARTVAGTSPGEWAPFTVVSSGPLGPPPPPAPPAPVAAPEPPRAPTRGLEGAIEGGR